MVHKKIAKLKFHDVLLKPLENWIVLFSTCTITIMKYIFYILPYLLPYFLRFSSFLVRHWVMNELVICHLDPKSYSNEHGRHCGLHFLPSEHYWLWLTHTQMSIIHYSCVKILISCWYLVFWFYRAWNFPENWSKINSNLSINYSFTTNWPLRSNLPKWYKPSKRACIWALTTSGRKRNEQKT